MKNWECVVTGEEMRAYDTYTIGEIGIPALVLMERAALAVVSAVESYRPRRVLCVCGMGNNGGDGYAAARILLDKGYEVEVAAIGNFVHESEETKKQLGILKQYGVKPHRNVPEGDYDVIVDALLGTGLSRTVEGVYLEAIQRMNRMQGVRISVDLPSGISADTGAVLGEAVRAEKTVSLAFLKRGICLYPGADYAGEIVLADIGISEKSFAGKAPGMYTYLGKGEDLFPKRRKDGNKGTFGKLLMAVGSEQMAGAAILSATAAYRMGVGMVKLVTAEPNRLPVLAALPEAMLSVYASPKGLSEVEKAQLAKDLEWADAVVVGCGLAVCESGRELLSLALACGKPLLVDADGLNLLAKDDALLSKLKEESCGTDIVLTPHMGELARLLHCDTKEVIADEVAATKEAAELFGCVVVGKSARTQISMTNRPLFLNVQGNDKMATAGSGDVLAGMIGALLAGGADAFTAARNGVILHALAGDAAAAQIKKGGMTAGEIIRGLANLSVNAD